MNSSGENQQMHPPHSPRRVFLSVLLFLSCLAAAAVEKPPTPDPAPEKADQQLRELWKRAHKYTQVLPVADSKPIDELREDVLRFLQTKEGQAHAEPCLRMLSELRLATPRPGEAPPAPKFPFDAATAQRYQKDYASYLCLPVEFTNGLGMTFVLVPPGTFQMGSPAEEPGHNASGYEETAHSVTLTRPFYLSKHEATVGQFRRFVEATRYVTDGEKNDGGHAHDDKAEWKHRPGTNWRKPGYAGTFTLTDQHPVVHVSHADSKACCVWLQGRFQSPDPDRPLHPTVYNWTYDLPAEAQWEWACRSGSAARYWWGPDEDTTGKVANVGDRSLKRQHPDWPRSIMPMDDGQAFAAPVGSYRANAFGLHDMLGNVWEFCSTRYGPYPKVLVTDPTDGDPKRGFAVRGGGWSNEPRDARCASRNADPPHFCHSNLGFRVALVLAVPKKDK
jgi:formylglycine-generating enzyme